jgi:hypothetical protein
VLQLFGDKSKMGFQKKEITRLVWQGEEKPMDIPRDVASNWAKVADEKRLLLIVRN